MDLDPKKKVIVLDTSAFIMGYNPLSIDVNHYTVPKVFEELIPETTAWLRLKIALETGKIRLQTPSQEFSRMIDESSTATGDDHTLSNVDKQVLALSMELKYAGMHPIIVSDDYAIQNIADRLGLEYTSLSTFGIRYRYEWILYCPACSRKYSMELTKRICGVCGTHLKRRGLRKEPVRKGRFTTSAVQL